jgi:PTH1 family peptidyl-tRNA hydrolase
MWCVDVVYIKVGFGIDLLEGHGYFLGRKFLVLGSTASQAPSQRLFQILPHLCYYKIMISIVGLGNPGEEYKDTRHNTGRIILQNIAKSSDFSEWKPARPDGRSGGNDMKLKSLHAKGEIGNEKFDFILPETFMNNSGNAVCQVIDDKKKLKNLVVIYDDIDLPFGTLKVSFNRSSGGHNGLESVIKKVKSREFIRIRIGISPSTPSGKIRKPKGEEAILKYLLGKFKEDELKELKKLSKKVVEILEVLSCDGKDKAMSLFN